MFATHAADYRLAGWLGILPVPPQTKTPPPEGFTGAAGRDPEVADLMQWAGTMPGHSLALRMPPGVIGIDVDQYTKAGKEKHGARTLEHHASLWGPLPPTWSSTSRGNAEGPGPSRIMLFRVPAQRYATLLQATHADGSTTSDVEVIQRHHRYAVVPPSIHPDTGAAYTWYTPEGTPAPIGTVPRPEDLAELPHDWVAGLAAGASQASPEPAAYREGMGLLAQLEADTRPECAEMTSLRLGAQSRVGSADPGSRHDTVTGQVYAAVRTGAAGHPGSGGVIAQLRQLWDELTPGEDRGEEFERMLLSAARKAVTAVGTRQVPDDPCLLAGGFVADAPSADAEGSAPLTDGQPYYPYQVIGAQAFDPNANLDQPLAQETLQRLHPYMRWAYDARVWLVRRPTRWEIHKAARATEMAQHGAALVAHLMPRGNPEAEKGSADQLRAARYTRYNTSAGARGVANKMADLVTGGTHPCSLKLGTLDADPEQLWAGGLPYDLRRAGTGVPLEQWIDHAAADQPHVHTAAVSPAAVPTPLWDAFVAAVFPDPDVRHWAMRVLAVAVTGYSDRVLPILLGESGRGKTQLMVLMMSLLGTYAHAADPKLLSPAAENAATGAIVYALRGRRLSFIDEGPREGRFAQERLKQLTGGGELTADDKYQAPVTWRPTHTLVLTTNDEPNVTDPAVWARTRIIPCAGDPDLVSSTRAAIGPTSSKAWRAEAPGVLHQLMCEAGAYLRNVHSASQAAAPEAIRDLAEQMALAQDPVLRWLTEETEAWEPGTPSATLYQQFVASCRQANMRPDTIPTVTAWGRTVTKFGYPPEHTRGGKVRQCRVRPDGFDVLPTPEPRSFSVETRSISDPTSQTAPVTGCDGFVTGLEATRHGQNTLSDQNASGVCDGLTGLTQNTLTYTHAPAHTKAIPEKTRQPVTVTENERLASGDTPSKPVTQPVTEAPNPSQPKQGLEGARAKRAEAAAQARAAAVAEAQGEPHRLPALLQRDGTIAELAPDQADAFLATLPELTVDVETTGYPVGHQHYGLRTVQLGGPAFAVVFDATDEAQRGVIRAQLSDQRILHAHSATADLVPLEVAGLLPGGIEEAWTRMHDTVIPAKLADPASTGSDPGLKQLAPAVLGDQAVVDRADQARAQLFRAGKWLTEVKATTDPARSGWAQVAPTSATMIRYAGSDVLDTAAVAARLPVVPADLLDRERLTQRVTARVTHTGLLIDGTHTEQLLDQHTAAATTAAELVRSAGIENPGSNPQIAAALEGLGAALPRTATGKPSVRSGVLERLRANQDTPAGQLAAAVLTYREHSKLISTYLEPYLEQARYGDGRIRPTIYTLAADTGRMSSVRPNIQQVPRSGGIRACITADPGDLIVSADFSGVELRVAAALSGDANLASIMSDPDRDLHWEVARLAFGPQATKANRYAVKRGVFGRIYGGGVGTIATSVGVSQDVAQQIVDALDQLTPGLTEWSRQIREGVKAGHTKYPTYSGRVIHLDPDLPHKAPNYLIQGTARELLVDAIVRFAGTRWGDRVLVPVHDELVVLVPQDEADQATQALTEAMYTKFRGVPIVPEASEPSFEWKDSE